MRLSHARKPEVGIGQVDVDRAIRTSSIADSPPKKSVALDHSGALAPQVRASRSLADVEQKLAALEAAARSTGNLLPPILEAAACYTTVGEIPDRLRAVFGEYREV